MNSLSVAGMAAVALTAGIGADAQTNRVEVSGECSVPNAPGWVHDAVFYQIYPQTFYDSIGDGTYLNPILPGDHPDPTILKDGDGYYMTFSSFNSYPGIVIWHSKDLVNWKPVGPALKKNIGTVWALDLCKYKDRYYIYIPVLVSNGPIATYVIWANHIEGPWSDPINLKIDGCIDPGHIVGEDGKRYLFVNGIRRIRLTDDGFATARLRSS